VEPRLSSRIPKWGIGSLKLGKRDMVSACLIGYSADLDVSPYSHPPTYYLPPNSIQRPELFQKTPKHTFCEWKGVASYFTFKPPTSSSDASGPASVPKIENRIWTYENPTQRFVPIKDYYCFYASSSQTIDRGSTRAGWRCEVDGEVVKPQEG
jgi:uncharacterized protein (DUF427 family)